MVVLYNNLTEVQTAISRTLHLRPEVETLLSLCALAVFNDGVVSDSAVSARFCSALYTFPHCVNKCPLNNSPINQRQ